MRAFSPHSLTKPKGSVFLNLPPGFFDNPLPVDLEIGAGVGWHAITYAQQNPLRRLIAIERTKNKFEQFVRRTQQHPSLPQLYPIHSDVIPWSVHHLPDSSIDQFFIYYPNPYPKNSSARFFKMPFFEYLLKKGKPQALVHLATNVFDYQEEAQRMAQEQWYLKLISYRELLASSMFKPRTHFEKKYLLRGETCYDLIFQKS